MWRCRRCKPGRGARAFLLVEAMLAVVVIAVSLVVISQAIAASLQTVRRLRAIQRQVAVAESLLNRLEVEAQQWAVRAPQDERAEPPDDQYAWELRTITPPTDVTDALFGSVVTVTLSVRPADNRYGATILQALWPATWVK